MNRQELNVVLESANIALLNKDMSEVERTTAELKEAAKKYNAAKVTEHFTALYELHTEETPFAPMMAAIKALSTEDCVRVKLNTDKDTGMSEFELADNPIQISLSKFSDFGKIRRKFGVTPDAHFFCKIEAFNLKMTYRVLSEIGDVNALPKHLLETYSIRKIEGALKLGKTPLSNSQMLKDLQGIVDAIAFTDNGTGGNIYKVTSHDVAYIRETYAKRGKTSGTVVCPKHETLAMLIMDMLHKIVMDKKYVGEYTTRKPGDSPVMVTKADATKVEQTETELINSVIDADTETENE